MKFVPARTFDNGIEAFAKGATGDAQAINSTRIRFNQVAAAQLDWINTKIMGYFVEMHFYSITRLCCTMPALRTARRFVSEKPHGFEFITGKLVRHGLQSARVIRCSNTIGPICAAVEKGAEVHGSQRSILFHASLDPHFDRVTSPVNQEHFFAGTGNFDGSACTTRQFSGANFMRKGIAFATETSPYIGCDNSYM